MLGDIHYPVTVVDIDALIDKFKNIKNIDLEDENVKEHYALIRDGQRQFQKARTAIETARKEFKNSRANRQPPIATRRSF